MQYVTPLEHEAPASHDTPQRIRNFRNNRGNHREVLTKTNPVENSQERLLLLCSGSLRSMLDQTSVNAPQSTTTNFRCVSRLRRRRHPVLFACHEHVLRDTIMADAVCTDQ